MRLSHSTCADVEAYLAHSKTVVLAVGSIENHGRHLPLGTDTLIPDKILELLEARSGVLIAPTVPYGAAGSLMGFPGTVSLGAEGLLTVLRAITDSLYRSGFRRFVLVNGHGGNVKSIELLGRRMYERGAYVANLNWWIMAGELNPAWAGGHGGAEETAGVMAVDPALIRRAALRDPLVYTDDISPDMPSSGWDRVTYRGAGVLIPRPAVCYNKNGWLGPDAPSGATPEWGAEMLAAMADYIAAFVEDFEKVPLPPAPARSEPGFSAV